MNKSFVLLGWKLVAGQKHRNQSQRRQEQGCQRPVEEPPGCDGEERQGGGDTGGEDHQSGGHQLSEDWNPVHCGGRARLAWERLASAVRPRPRVFTQRVDDPHGQPQAEEHEEPAEGSHAPGHQAVGLVGLRKHLLQDRQ